MMSGCLFFLALILYGLMAIASTHSYTSEWLPSMEATSTADPTATYKYDRIDEVKKKCEFVLSSASEFKLDRSKIYDIKEELYVMNGDWGQEAGAYPLLPFDDTNKDNYTSPLKLVSFWVSDVERDYQSPKSANVNGMLVLSISIYGPTYFDKTSTRQHFQIWPGHSQLSIFFQGIYTESESNGGEKVMCLLGNGLLPNRDPADPWQRVKNSGQDLSSLSEDDQILLVLRFPLKFTLTNRGIKGQMTSLNPKSNPKYFDEVAISSQLTKSENYEFSSQNIVSRACDPYPYEDKSIGEISTFKGLAFCETLEEIMRYQAFSVLPNWRCNATGDVCRKMGPYGSPKTTETDGVFKVAKLSMQIVKCERVASPGSPVSARVSAVFRAISSSENPYSAGKRSGFSNMSLAAEGIWKSSSGQLCMVGCLGHVDAEGNSCNSRICMYISTYFSIKQRSIIFGTISSMDKGQSFFPLSFEKSVQQLSQLWHYFRNSRSSYNYTKSNAAALLLEKDRGPSFGTVIKKSLLEFPRLEDVWSFENSLSMLSEDLTFHVSAGPDPKPDPNVISTQVNLDLEIISVGPLFGRRWSDSSWSDSRWSNSSWSNSSFGEEENSYHVKAEFTEKQLLLNVSAQLTLTGGDFKNFSALSLEGLYDPRVGKMYLVGCRDIRASWEILFDGMDVEDGLDCSIEVVISYPPTTDRWLVNPTASISISSQRTENSPLHFGAVKFKTSPIMYRNQREDILSRRGVEIMLRILTLSLAIACISSQIFYTRRNAGSVPFISLVMLGVQAIGFIVPLVTGAEALFERAASDSYNDLDGRLWYRLTNYSVKLLVMISLLLTLRLCQKVWKSRVGLLAHSPVEPYRSPSDKLVLIATVLTHLVGFVLVTFAHGSISSKRLFWVRRYSNSRRFGRTMQVWERELEEYAGLVQDFFLFPQVIGNLLWQIDGKPLRKLYFIGITLVRLLPHFYNYFSAPENPYFAEEYEFVNPRSDYFSKFGDTAIPMTAVFLAVLVYIQQKWSYTKLSRALTLGRFKLLPVASRGYDRLPSIQAESELSSGVNARSTTHHGNHTELD